MAAGACALAAAASAPAYAAKENVPVKPAKAKQLKNTGVFGSLVLRTNTDRGSQEWIKVFSRINAEAGRYNKCDTARQGCHPKIVHWRKTISSLKGLPAAVQLAAVNLEINSLIRYRDDSRAYGQADHWATPIEALTGFGDCEDYAILKYMTLIELGYRDDQLKIVVVKDKTRRIGHAVLAVSIGAEIKILDNLARNPVQHTKISSYQPVYSVNRTGRWLNIAVRSRKTKLAVKTIDPGQPHQAALSLALRPTLDVFGFRNALTGQKVSTKQPAQRPATSLDNVSDYLRM